MISKGEPLVGFEPTTARLRIESSTPELQWPVIRCPGADSNRDAFRHYPLKIACLPVSPPGRRGTNIPTPRESVNPDASRSAALQSDADAEVDHPLGIARKVAVRIVPTAIPLLIPVYPGSDEELRAQGELPAHAEEGAEAVVAGAGIV